MIDSAHRFLQSQNLVFWLQIAQFIRVNVWLAAVYGSGNVTAGRCHSPCPGKVRVGGLRLLNPTPTQRRITACRWERGLLGMHSRSEPRLPPSWSGMRARADPSGWSGLTLLSLQLSMEETEIMQPSRRTFLKGMGAGGRKRPLWAGPPWFAESGCTGRIQNPGHAALGQAPWSTASAPSAPVPRPRTSTHISLRRALPDVQFTSDHGPGPYANMESKYLVQAKTGTPDMIEGLLENVVAYRPAAGDIVPIDSQFKAWSDYSQFVPSAINAVQYNGQTLGIPYNTNARGMLYRKSVLKKLGLKPPTTWDELVSSAEHITAKLSGTTGMAGVMFCTSLTDPRGAQEFLGLFFQTNQHLFKLDSTGKKWMVNATPGRVGQKYCSHVL